MRKADIQPKLTLIRALLTLRFFFILHISNAEEVTVLLMDFSFSHMPRIGQDGLCHILRRGGGGGSP